MTIENPVHSVVSLKAKLISIFLHVFLLAAILWPNTSRSIPKITELAVSVEFEPDSSFDTSDAIDPHPNANNITPSNPSDPIMADPAENSASNQVPIVESPATTVPPSDANNSQVEAEGNVFLADYELPLFKPIPMKPVVSTLPLPSDFPPIKPAPVKPVNTVSQLPEQVATNLPNFIPVKPLINGSSSSNSSSLPNNHNQHKPVTLEEQKLIMEQIHQNWSTDNGGRNYEQFHVVIIVQLRADGTIFNLKSQPDPAFGNDSYYASFVRNAENAVRKTAKIVFPKERYEDFKELELVFSP